MCETKVPFRVATRACMTATAYYVEQLGFSSTKRAAEGYTYRHSDNQPAARLSPPPQKLSAQPRRSDLRLGSAVICQDVEPRQYPPVVLGPHGVSIGVDVQVVGADVLFGHDLL